MSQRAVENYLYVIYPRMVTPHELSEKLNISESSISINLRKLRNSGGIIERIPVVENKKLFGKKQKTVVYYKLTENYYIELKRIKNEL